MSFAILLLAGAVAAPVCWIGHRLDLYPPGMARLALDPGRIVLAEAAAAADRLALQETALRGGMHAVAFVDHVSRLAARRLALAARRGGRLGLVLHGGAAGDSNAFSARWRIAAAPSGAAGAMRWRAELLHVRNARPGAFLIEADDDGTPHALDPHAEMRVQHPVLRRVG